MNHDTLLLELLLKQISESYQMMSLLEMRGQTDQVDQLKKSLQAEFEKLKSMELGEKQ